MRNCHRVLSTAAVLWFASCATSPTLPTGRPSADELAVRALVLDVYAIVSGEQGQARDWDRLRKLFADGGTMHVSMRRGDATVAAKFDVEQFIAMATQNSQREAFFESPLVTRVETFAGVGYAWSSYAARNTKAAEPFARGVNCFTFMKGKDGWRIVMIAWSEETDGDRLPASLLPDAAR